MFGLSCTWNLDTQILSCWNEIYSLCIFSLYSERRDEEYLNRGPGVGGTWLRFLVQPLTGYAQMTIWATSCINVCTTDDVIMIAEGTGTKYVALSNWGCYLIAFSDKYSLLPLLFLSLGTPWESKTFWKVHQLPYTSGAAMLYFKLQSTLVVSSSLMCGLPYPKIFLPEASWLFQTFYQKVLS